ncbi:carboxypeptidase-like regulatory domain-containing protein [Hymenobacter rubripertinctus]|uniref:Carboxypeptidase-like regulatory domain-containing protein n=1 Tax=Hymenobacter rubripertinctus TaxID=2029981 RepID=A0A418R666_9BACT|nr:carboxypeptidase-like regulatory domain-containing protein [Hymenobacter rubripertinctus]RIY13050.1 carboxypeptidase-like regulatory domain-containing protein [Hymenobacter rubripertinctus]
MRRSLTLTIPEPCHESWATMTPAAQGRHCAACAKTVVDFSCMSDAQVVAWLVRPAKGKVCGRFAAPQLNRPLIVPDVVSRWPRSLVAVLALLGLSATLPTIAQSYPDSNTVQPLKTQWGANDPAATHLIRGRVVDAHGKGLPGATVLVEGTRNGVSTTSDGTYQLGLSAAELSGRLVFSALGFEVVVKPLGSTDRLKTVVMKDSGDVMGIFYISRWYTPRGLWQRLTRPFRR